MQIVSTAVLARLLTPADFGIVAMVTAVTAFAGLFRDLGLSTASIQKRDLTHGQQCNLFWINVGVGATLSLLTAAASPLVAWFYGQPELTLVTLALSVNFLFSAAGAQSHAALTREMNFGRNGLAEIAGAVVGLVVAVTFAIAGTGYWALVAGTLSAASVSLTCTLLASPFRPGLWRRGEAVGDMVRFGINVTMFGIVNYLHRYLDSILIGRIWGANALGLYSRAYSLAQVPLQNLRGPFTTVLYASTSNSTEQAVRVKLHKESAFAIGLIAFLCFPALAIGAGFIVDILLGDGWAAAKPVFRCLAVAELGAALIAIINPMMLGSGESQSYLKWGVVKTAIAVVAIAVAVPFGIVAVAISLAVASVATVLPSLVYAAKVSGTPVASIVDAYRWPAVASGVSAAAGVAVAYQAAASPLTDGWHEVSGVVTYVLLYFFFFVVCRPARRAAIHLRDRVQSGFGRAGRPVEEMS